MICLKNRNMKRRCFCAKKIETVETVVILRKSYWNIFSNFTFSGLSLCMTALRLLPERSPFCYHLAFPQGGGGVNGLFRIGQNGQYILPLPKMKNSTQNCLLQCRAYLYKSLYCEKPTRLPNIYWMICAWYC